MTTNETIENAKVNIEQALEDYGKHTHTTEVLDDISDSFINRLAKDSTHAKQELRELFSTSPVWDEKLDALIINGTRTHNPNYGLISNLAHQILNPAFSHYDGDTLRQAVYFFSRPDDDPTESIAAITALAPKAYAPNKKQSRIFKALCDAVHVSDDSAGSEFQRLYAQFADELTAKKLGFKLYVSLNPAHFLTMSNPKNDDRGSTLTSCHSFNSTEYEYNCGCAGFARDKTSFIVFTSSDPKLPETLNNRKTTRQVFAYKPGNGLLLQSRMYNTDGGTRGAQEESKVYRDLVQREISNLEGVPNLWKTSSYLGGKEDCVQLGDGFGGYPDWTYEGFDGKISIRSDCEDAYKSLSVGTYGLCIKCADKISSHLYCSDCDDDRDNERCAYCENSCSEVFHVHGRNGEEEYVCDNCRDEHYHCCEQCNEYYHEDTMHNVGSETLCSDCVDEYYTECSDCGELYRNDDTYMVFDKYGNEVDVCCDCRDDHYIECYHCEEYHHIDRIVDAHDVNGNEIDICDICRENHYVECDNCGEVFDADVMENGLCTNCKDNADEEETETETETENETEVIA